MRGPPLRVLFLTPYFRPYLGGIERAIEQLSFQLLESANVEAVGVLTTKYSFPRVPQPDWADREITPEGISIYRLSGYPGRSIPLYSVPLVWFSPFRVRRYLEEFAPNVVHFVGDGWFWGHFWSWYWFRRKAKFIFTPSYHELPVSRWWLRPINGFICKVVDGVVALTQQESDLVHRDYWAPRRNLSVIGWGAPMTPPHLLLSAENPRVPGNEDEPLTLLCVGRLGLHKAQGWLLDVYTKARPQFERSTRLVLVGRDEGEERNIRRTVQSYGLQDEVMLTGELDDDELREWYARADVFTLFSHYEAFGLVFFEAMAYGAPVLTHDVGANRELLVRGAHVVPRFDEDAAIKSMVRLVNDEAHRQELSLDAQEYALAEFTWSVTADKYLSLYQPQ
jgi:glycosyltransferase involved in cell wall biosynthesis